MKKRHFQTKEEKITNLELIGQHLSRHFVLMVVLSSFLFIASLFLCIYWNFDEYSAAAILGPRGEVTDILYLVCHIVYAFLSALIIVAFILRRVNKLSNIALAIIIHIYALLIINFSCLLSILDLTIGLSPISFILALITIGGIFVIEPIFYAVISLGYYSVIMAFQLANQYAYFTNLNKFENIIFFFFIVVVCLLVAFRAFNVTKRGYHSRKELERLTYFDELTGLYNERSYLNEIDKINEDIKNKECEDFAILMMDLNNLKATNDKYGHRYGCHLVIKCGEYLPKMFPNSKLFHVGGDEFIAIVRGEDFVNFDELLKKFDESYEYKIVKYEGVELIFSVARGYAKYNKQKRYQDVLQIADKLMYENKAYIKEKHNFKGR